jgi:low affinity Fe/Cu permease
VASSIGATPQRLVINTGTTIVTFLEGLLIQSTQNRDRGGQVKLRLLRATVGAHNALLDLGAGGRVDRVRDVYCRLAEKARADPSSIHDTGAPDLPGFRAGRCRGARS